MTILCVTNDRLPGIRPCTLRDVHRVTCHDHPGWTVNPGTCTGCLPREASRGFLCRACYARVEDALLRWDQFARMLRGVDRAVTPEPGPRSSQQGWVPFPGTYLALDECERFLASRRGRRLEEWVSNEAGAADAIQFAHAAERAYRTHQVEEQAARLHRFRCQRCGQLATVRNPPMYDRARITVRCENCHHTIYEGDMWTSARLTTDGDWEAFKEEAIDVIADIETRRTA